jgi:hypothetical protein
MIKLSLMTSHMSFMINVWYLPYHFLNDYCLKQLIHIDFKAFGVMDDNDMGSLIWMFMHDL